MATLRPPETSSSIKHKAVQDAHRTQASVEEECASSGVSPPPYTLEELIGKGTFGRVYKATSKSSGQVVAVKIISIESADILDPKRSDTFRDIIKEVNTLKLLSTTGAKNVNVAIDALLFGQTMWMVTELCAGGSVSTLMRPTGGLPEKWIVPILREVAVALYWVHNQGIIHRDVKCANVLITDAGQVQLCDFGVAGIIEGSFDKRSTVTGTLQWMAPELFDSHVSYGTEVDIWAFGSMAYEVATGLPPNAATAIDISSFGTYLKQHVPRLEGDKYSSGLKDLVAYCMVHDPKKRPPIELVQIHSYIYDTEKTFPTTSLLKLVSAYRLWESQGGSRQSLFAAGGAQGPTSEKSSGTDEEWDFNAADDPAPQSHLHGSETQVLHDVYGSSIDVPPFPQPPSQPAPRRRKPPQNLRPFKAPLEKAFDPNTISNYHEIVRDFYERPPPPCSSDLPLRDDTKQSNLRESLIDLDASLTRISQKALRLDDLETIRPNGKPLLSGTSQHNNRRTQDWTFPVMSPLSPEFDHARFVPDEKEATPKDGDNIHGEPTPRKLGNANIVTSNMQENRVSTISLIDLDDSLTPETSGAPRPTTAGSDGGSVASDLAKTPFEFDRHVSIVGPPGNQEQHPNYASFDKPRLDPGGSVPHGTDVHPMIPQQSAGSIHTEKSLPDDPPRPALQMPPAPLPPLPETMEVSVATDDAKAELRRLIESLNDHLKFTSGALETLPVQRASRDQGGESVLNG